MFNCLLYSARAEAFKGPEDYNHNGIYVLEK
jgi:hypothetical protein